MNHSTNHVVRVCLLEMFFYGKLKLISPDKLKVCSYPSFKYQKAVAKEFRKAKSIREGLKKETVSLLIKVALARLSDLGLISTKWKLP